MDYADIGWLLGIPRGTAMSHLYRASRFLRRC